MAATRQPRKKAPELTLGPVVLDEQALRDIVAVYDRVIESSEYTDRPVQIGFNGDYDAETIDDLLETQRPVESVNFYNSDFSVHIDMAGVWIRGTHVRESAHWVSEVGDILRPRVIPATPQRLLTSRLIWVTAIAAAVSFFISTAVHPLFGWQPPALLGVTVQLGIMVVYWQIPERPRKRAARSSLFDSPDDVQPFVRRWNTELTLGLLLLAIVVPSVLALTK